MATKQKPLSGFPELLPAERIVELEIIKQISAIFELHGFSNIETRAVEPVTQLLQKGETSKEIYLLRRLQEEADAAPASLGLHFDLTVPFARYVLENAANLEFPFRRYQIQKVWRGERPQTGRFREFTQADIDVVGRGELNFHHDVEVAKVMAAALASLEYLPQVKLLINNRKLLQGFYQGLGINDYQNTMRVVDKLAKIGPEKTANLLATEAGLTEHQIEKLLALAEISAATGSELATKIAGLGVTDPLLEQGVAELAAVLAGCAEIPREKVAVTAALWIARGLDYYTGTVFETELCGYESLGSVCSGGRYDQLANDGKTAYPGVGISLGLSRLVVPLISSGKLIGSRSVPSVVLVAVLAEETRAVSETVAAKLRQRGIACEVSPDAAKLGKQIKFAEKRGINYVWFPDSNELKDIRSGVQITADATVWTPEVTELRPAVIVKEIH